MRSAASWRTGSIEGTGIGLVRHEHVPLERLAYRLRYLGVSSLERSGKLDVDVVRDVEDAGHTMGSIQGGHARSLRAALADFFSEPHFGSNLHPAEPRRAQLPGPSSR